MDVERIGSLISSSAALAALLAGTLGATPPPAGQPLKVSFATHAAFFSQATHRTPALDPQIFVRQDAVPPGTGPQGIEHVAGVRPAQPDDVPDLVAYDAQGRSLGFSLARWFGASGSATFELLPSGGERIHASFGKLLPFGVYSLFRIEFTPAGAVFTPLDGSGVSNTFTAGADGSGGVELATTTPLAAGDAVVLIYHSDGTAHGAARGEIGLTAHQQLIVRLP
jgi:hypothetical protein